ncbi:hypothetical protein LCGC14_1842560 [marine sediment metagenome]|uniref:Uncharacterized protein n=1 Tax=marine sediment metagenome TaxID=412755 RepID=A0A0F9H0Z7_9ZZZZ
MGIKICLGFIFLLLVIPTIISQQEDIRFYSELNTNTTVYEKCRINGALCGADFACNLTTLYPNQSFVIDSVIMVRGITYYNLTLNKSQINVNGIYENTVDCGNTTSFGSNTFFFQITPNGSVPFDEAQGLIIIVSIFVIIIGSCFCIYLGIKIRNEVVSIILISFAVILAVFALGMTLNIIELAFGTFSGIINNYSALYILFVALVGAGVISLIVYLVKISLELYWKNRGASKETFDEQF